MQPRQPRDQLPVPAERNKPASRSHSWLFFLRPPWRGYAFKLGVGLGVASLAVAYQNEPPRREAQGIVALNADRILAAPIAQLVGHKGPVARVTYARSGRVIVSAGTDSTLRIWDAETSQLQRTVPLDGPTPASIMMDERTALVGYASGQLTTYDLDRGEKTSSVTQGVAISAVAPTPDPGIHAVAFKGTSLALIDHKAPTKPVAMAEGHDGEIRAMLPMLARAAVASGGTDKTVRLWSSDALAPIRTYRGHAATVTALAAPADGRALASASQDGQVRIWSTASSRVIRSFKAHNGAVAVLAYAASGETLASAGADGQIRIWDSRRGKALITVEPGRHGPVRSMAFAPDGRRLVSGHDDGTVRIWDVGTLRIARDN